MMMNTPSFMTLFNNSVIYLINIFSNFEFLDYLSKEYYVLLISLIISNLILMTLVIIVLRSKKKNPDKKLFFMMPSLTIFKLINTGVIILLSITVIFLLVFLLYLIFYKDYKKITDEQIVKETDNRRPFIKK